LILDARNDGIGLDRSVDLVIVGSGPVGALLADTLADVAEILVVESGGLAAEAATEDLNVGAVIGLPYPLLATRTRQLGGSSTLWAGYCAPFDPHDFEPRPWVPMSGWPFPAEEIARFASDVAQQLTLSCPIFDASEVADAAAIGLPASVREHAGLWRFGAVKMRHGVEDARWGRHETLSVLLHATIVDILLDRSGSAADHVVVRTLNGREGVIRAKQIVLACGGIETARLLLNSDRQITAGIGNLNGLVGRCFMEHPHQEVAAFAVDRTKDLTGFLHRLQSGYGDEILFNLGLSPQEQAQRHLLNARAHFYHTPAMSEGDPPRLGLFAEQSPNPASRILLTDHRDALGLRRIALDWNLTELDWRSFAESGAALGRLLEANGYGHRRSLDRPPQDRSSILHSNHHLGTTRMACDPDLGVVDSDARIHGLENLYIMGGGVFPTVSWANPTFTLLALTLRLAEHLRHKFTPPPPQHESPK